MNKEIKREYYSFDNRINQQLFSVKFNNDIVGFIYEEV